MLQANIKKQWNEGNIAYEINNNLNYKTGKALAKNLRLVIAHARHKSLQLYCALKVEHNKNLIHIIPHPPIY